MNDLLKEKPSLESFLLISETFRHYCNQYFVGWYDFLFAFVEGCKWKVFVGVFSLFLGKHTFARQFEPTMSIVS